MPFPVDIEWISQTEERLGVKFPASFVVSMSKLNGGGVEIQDTTFWLHPFLDKSSRKRIQRTCSSICRETATLRELDWFPRDAVAIGHNGTGDALVLRPLQDSPTHLAHSVYWWDFHTSELDLVADDFGDLSRCT